MLALVTSELSNALMLEGIGSTPNADLSADLLKRELQYGDIGTATCSRSPTATSTSWPSRRRRSAGTGARWTPSSLAGSLFMFGERAGIIR